MYAVIRDLFFGLFNLTAEDWIPFLLLCIGILILVSIIRR